jgi:hypothetical protein
MCAHIHTYIYVHILIHNALGWTIATEYVNIIECVHIYIWYMCYIYIIYACAFTPLVRAYPKWLIDTKLMAKQHYWKVTCRPPLGAVSWCLSDGFKKKDWNKNNLYYNMTHKKMSNIYEGSEHISDVVRIFSSIHDAAPPILDPSPSRLRSRAAVLKTVKSVTRGFQAQNLFHVGNPWDPLRSIDIRYPKAWELPNQVFPMIFPWIFQF